MSKQSSQHTNDRIATRASSKRSESSLVAPKDHAPHGHGRLAPPVALPAAGAATEQTSGTASSASSCPILLHHHRHFGDHQNSTMETILARNVEPNAVCHAQDAHELSLQDDGVLEASVSSWPPWYHAGRVASNLTDAASRTPTYALINTTTSIRMALAT